MTGKIFGIIVFASAIICLASCGGKSEDDAASPAPVEEAASAEAVTEENAAPAEEAADTEEIAATETEEADPAEEPAEEPAAEETATIEPGIEETDEDIAVETDAFYITEITDDIFERIKGKSFKDNCTLPREDLRYLHVLHKDLDGNVHEGEMIVNYHIADDVLDILKQLYEADYPIEKIRLVDEYDADDEASMEDNNSSSFNFRYISHTHKISNHGYGLAVDINTLYNPYIKTVNGEWTVEPANAGPYTDRNADFPYKIDRNDLCYKLFTEKGFEWGGDWNSVKDYQHFEVPAWQIEEWYPQ